MIISFRQWRSMVIPLIRIIVLLVVLGLVFPYFLGTLTKILFGM